MPTRIAGYVRRNHIALLALFVALGGTSYAAVSLPKNSVGAKQLRNSSVTSPKVKNGSLLAKDFKAGQLPKGDKGDKGDTGAQGPQGVPGTPGKDGRDGADGARGPSNAYFDNTNIDTGTITTTDKTVATKDVPATGDGFVVAASVDITATTTGQTFTCSLKAGGSTLQTVSSSTSASTQHGPIALEGAFLEGPATISVACKTSTGTANVTSAVLTAIEVATLERRPTG